MAFAPPKTTDGSKLQFKLSTWTPLNHQLMNDKVFEERRALLGKWFDKWTDGQRRRILVDLLERCSLSQQKFCAKQLQARVPTEAVDFTTRLPRVLSLYIFSFLDPRSLCRCAQTPSKDEFIVIDVQPVKSNVPERKLPVAGRGTTRGKKELPPWRSSDRNPTDTIRYNYLDNYDPIEQARQARRKGGGRTPDLSRQEAERKKRGARGSNQLRKVKSLLSLCADLESLPKPPVRPSWATPQQTGNLPSKAAAKALAQSSRWNAGIRPGPVRAPKPRERGTGDGTRMGTRSPSSPLFEAQPWHIPSSNQGSDTE
ncbi:F-box only protein 16 isoform 3-T4 [Cyanocitta cristata]